MEAVLTHIADYLWRQSWQIVLLVAAVALVSWFLRHRSAHVRYLLWLLVLAKCLVPPVVQIPWPVLPGPTPVGTAPAAPAAPFHEVITERSVPEEPRSTSSSPTPVPLPPTPVSADQGSLHLTTPQWLAVGWVAGAVLFLCVALAKAACIVLWLRHGRQLLPRVAGDSFDETFRSFRVRRPPRVWLMANIGQPFVWGLLRGEIYLPDGFVRIESWEHRRDILAHEISHVLRFDAAMNILQIIAQAIFWFHPLVWWANQRIRREREKCCDEMAIASLDAKPKDYGAAILNTLIQAQESTGPVPSLAVAGPVKNIEERIRAMLKPGKKFYEHPGLVASTLTAFAALLTIPTALVLTARAQTDTPKPKGQTAQVQADTPTPQAQPSQVQTDVPKLQTPQAQTDAPKLQPKAVTPLCEAASMGDIDQVRSLLAQGADVNVKDYRLYTNGMTPLQCAALNGRKNVVELLLEKGADVDAVGHSGHTAVLFAIMGGSPNGKDIVWLLLAKGAQASALHMAAYLGDVDKAKTLLDQGMDVDAKWKGFDVTPLWLAALGGQPAVAKFLIDRGANVNQGLPGGVPLRVAIAFGERETVRLLIDKGADIQGAEKSGASVLASLAGGLERTLALLVPGKDKAEAARSWWEGRRESVKLVMAEGGHIPASVAALALSVGLKDLVELAIDSGLDVNARTVSRQDKTLLHEAVGSGQKELVQYLLDKGADVNAKEQRGWTPLHMAVNAGAWNIVELLLTKGADVNAADLRGATAMWYARKQRDEEMTQLLRRHGAHEQTPPTASLPEAARDGDLELVKSLVARRADVNAMDNRLAGTSLHLAASFGREGVVEFLLSQGANVNAVNKWNRTALDEAMDRERTAIIEVLRSHGAKPGSAVEMDRTERAKSLLGNVPSKYKVPPKDLEIPEAMQSCAANLRKIYAAIQKYEKDKGTLPNWLSDLVPDYVSPETLLCPHNPVTKGPVAAVQDPKPICSYQYEFNLNRYSLRQPAPGVTTRDWKIAEVEVFGDLVPLVRCWTHGSLNSAMINLDLNGRIYLSAMGWERMFMPDWQTQGQSEVIKILEGSSR
jgi:cytohesin